MSDDLIIYLPDGTPIGCTTNHIFRPNDYVSLRCTGPEQEMTIRLMPSFDQDITFRPRTLAKRIGRQHKAKKAFRWTLRTRMYTPRSVRLSVKYLLWIRTTTTHPS